jgi:methyl-accepting chemotaxis protein
VTENLSTLETQVEEARAKLAHDLAFLRSPQPYREFGADLRSGVQSGLRRMLDDLKARAAANPSAALAIGAGIAWRFMKDPPIATALIGAGMLSLWRSTPIRGDDEDYLRTAQERFGEQVSQVVDTVKDYAAETAVAVGEGIGTYAQSARETVENASLVVEKSTESVERARDAAKRIPDNAVNAMQNAKSQFGRAVSDEGVRDQFLLGVAGLAVVAALGIAYQRRTGDELRSWN